MPTQRKYPISIGMTHELLLMLDERVKSEELRSRSQLVERILRENIHSDCDRCQKVDKLVDNHLLNLPYEIEGTDEEFEFFIQERLQVRKERKTMIEIIRNETDLDKILNLCEENDIGRDKGIVWLDRFARQGILYRPSPNTIQYV